MQHLPTFRPHGLGADQAQARCSVDRRQAERTQGRLLEARVGEARHLRHSAGVTQLRAEVLFKRYQNDSETY